MIRCPLSMLPAAVVGTAALSIASAFATAQGTAAKPKSTPPAVNATVRPAEPTAPTSDDSVVGTCNAHKVTWGQLVARITQENPKILEQSVTAIVGTRAGEEFYGKTPKDTFTISKTAALAELRAHPNSLISQQLELMLTQFAVDDQATRENVQPTQKEVDDTVAAVLKGLRDNNTIPKTQTDAAFLASRNYTLDKLKTMYRPQCQILNLIRKETVKNLGHPIGPDDMIQVSHILIKDIELPATATSEDKAKANAATQARIREIEAEIKSGKVKFADDAKSQSEDPSTKDRGGEIGIFLRGSGWFGKDFESAAFAAKVNEVTEPVKSSQGYHIILVTKRGKDIPEAERKTFMDQYENAQIKPFLQKVVDTYNHVDNKLAGLVPPPMGGPFGGPQGVRPR